jgi:Calx-beta domain
MNTKLNLLAAGIFLTALSTGLGQSTIQFSTNLYYVAENAGSVTLTIQRTGDTNTTLTVDYATADGTATASLDYTATNGTLTFLTCYELFWRRKNCRTGVVRFLDV